MPQPAFPQTRLNVGESILWHGKPAYEAYLGTIIFAFIWSIIGLGLFSIPIVGPWMGGLLFLLPGGLILLWVWIKVNSMTYYVTNMRIVREYSLFGRSREETTLDHITDVVFNQGLFQQMMNYGNVVLHTAGTGFPGIKLEAVRDPVAVRRMIASVKEAYSRRGVGPPSSQPTSGNVYCGYCGSMMSPGAIYCPKCGRKQ